MADLVSSFSGFLFPEGFQPLDGCDDTDPDCFLKSTLGLGNCIDMVDNNKEENTEDGEFVPGPSTFQRPHDLTINTSLELGSEEVAVTEERDTEVPSTPDKPPAHLACLSPLTPTANLKVLISAASPDIRVLASKRQKKALFNAIADRASTLQEERSFQGGSLVNIREVEVDCMSQGEDAAEDGDKPINRKSKSLGLLCQRFLSRYPDYPENGVAMAISLDTISKDLGVERRRIYDIVNVLESIEMVSRVAKNKYLWHGKMNMEPTLARLKCLGEKKRYADQIVHLKKLQIQNEYIEELERVSKQPFRDISNSQDTEDKKEMDRFDEDMNSRRDKSLGVMSQKFIMLFLVSQAKVITLDIAARVLIGDINYEIREGSKFKTKVRRLYDIANILTSLEMIQKVHVQEGRGRKPAFRWIGPNPDTSHVNPSDIRIENSAPSRQSFFSTPAAPIPTPPPQETKPSPESPSSKGTKRVAWSRHASFNAICEVVERERRSYSSAPNSPTKDSPDAKPLDKPTDEKFRQDFEALRSKYPDQMAKIYVSEKQTSVKQEGISATPTRASPKVSVPVSSPKCIPGSTAGRVPLNPKVIVSPIPGSLPVSSRRRMSAQVSVPLSFNVIKSVVPVTSGFDALPNGTITSQPSSPVMSTTVSNSQFSLLTNTVNALNMVLCQPDATRRSKRTIKQPISGEFEYQPVVKRSKLTEHDMASGLKCVRQDLNNQMQPGQAKYLKIPVESKILQQPTGKPVQTIIIRRDVSVLNKNSNTVPTSAVGQGLEGGAEHPQGTVTTTLVPGCFVNRSRQQANPVNITPNATLGHPSSCATPPFVPQNTSPTPQLKGSPELICQESLSDIEAITSSAQLPFHDVLLEQSFHCLGEEDKSIPLMTSGMTNTKQQSDKKGLSLDISNDRKTGVQRSTKDTKLPTENRKTRKKEHHAEQKPVKARKRSSVARALYLSPEFKNARPAKPSGKASMDNAGELVGSVSADVLNEVERTGTRGNGMPRKRAIGKEINCDNDDEVLAWPLHRESREAAESVPSKIGKHLPTEESCRRPPSDATSCSWSLPCSPAPSLVADGHSSTFSHFHNGSKSLSRLGDTDPWWPSSGVPLSERKHPISSDASVGLGDRWRFSRTDALMIPHTACLSPVQHFQLFPSPSSDCRGQVGCLPGLGPHCMSSDRLSRISLPSVNSIQVPISCSSLTTQTVTTFPARPCAPDSSQKYPIHMIHPNLTNVKMSPLGGSFFRPISCGSNLCLPLRPDPNPNLTSPILWQQSGNTRFFSPIPRVLASPSRSRASPLISRPLSQSTPLRGHQLLPSSPVTPATQSTRVTFQGGHHRELFCPDDRRPRPFADISGNGLVHISCSPILAASAETGNHFQNILGNN